MTMALFCTDPDCGLRRAEILTGISAKISTELLSQIEIDELCRPLVIRLGSKEIEILEPSGFISINNQSEEDEATKESQEGFKISGYNSRTGTSPPPQ
jgi:hypothetical protein